MKRSPIRSKPKKLSDEERAVRAELARRSRGRCEVGIPIVCTGRAEHPHHRKLKKQLGEDSLVNFLHVCWACHRAIHASPNYSYEHGFLVKSWQNPAEVEVLAP
jgi:hypothetical protein